MVALSGLLHLLGAALGGLETEALILLPFGIAYIVAAAGLNRNWRWLGALMFVLLLVFAIAAYATLSNNSPVPAWVTWAIIALDTLAAFFLFLALWANPTQADDAL